MLANALLTAAVIGAATAQVPVVLRRDLLEKRQNDAACESLYSSFESAYNQIPTPADELLTALETVGPCITPSFTGKIESEYVSYTSAVLQWSSSYGSELNAIFTACSGEFYTADPCKITSGFDASTAIATATAIVSGSGGPLQTASSAGAGSSSPTATPAGVSSQTTPAASSQAASSQSTSATSTPTPTGAASRETGLPLAAGAAIAGFMGIVAML